MWFNHGGAIEFGQAMLHAGQLGELAVAMLLHISPVGGRLHVCSLQPILAYAVRTWIQE